MYGEAVTLLAGSANAAQPNVRKMDYDNTYFKPQWVLPSYRDNENLKPFTDGLLWFLSRTTGARDFGPERAVYADIIEREGGTMSRHRFVGQTLDSAGAALGNCIVQGFLTSAFAPAGLLADAFVDQMTSDPNGYYEFWTPYVGQQHYLVCYLAGSPDRTGASVNTLVPTAP